MGARRDLGRDFFEIPLHGLGVAAGQKEGGADTAPRADGTEYIGRPDTLILGRSGPCSLPRRTPAEICYLTNAGFILEPNFYCGIGGQGLADCRHLGGEVF